MTTNTIKEIVRNSIDLHVHIGPEVIPRKYTVRSLIEAEKGNIKGCVLKNHYYPTANIFMERDRKDILLFAGLVLNNSVGGLNPDAIYASALIAPKPLFVWLPTIHTKQFLENNAQEIPPEWINNDSIKIRPSSDVKPVIISENGQLTKNIAPALKAISDTDAVLCTGHISWKESVLVVEAAIKLGIKKIVITHPIYQHINMPISVQKELATAGCFIEHCCSMHTIDKIPVAKIAEQILEVGTNNVVFSSDVGQACSPSPSVALLNLMESLIEHGVSVNDIDRMCCKNPSKLLEI